MPSAFDDNGRAIATTDPFLRNQADINYIDPTTEQEYTDPGTPTFLRANHTIYDALGRVIETVRVKGVEVTVTPSAAPSGSDTIYETDFDENYSSSNILSTTKTFYDDEGRVDYSISEDPADQAATYLKTTFTYDEAGRQTMVVQTDIADNELGRTTSGYDALGRQDLSTDARNHSTGFRYDALGRVIKTTFNDSTFTETEYDALGRRSAEIEQLGQRTDFGYDDAGRLTSVLLPEVDNPNQPGGRIRPQYTYSYDAYGNQVSIVDPNSVVDPNSHRTEVSVPRNFQLPTSP